MKKLKILALLAMCSALLLTLTPAAGDAGSVCRGEVIYANLSATGAPEKIIAVRLLDVTSGGTLSEGGSYTAAENLSDSSGISLSGGKISAEAAPGRFCYRGTLEKPLPWSVEVSYSLDGVKAAPETLSGASGRLSIGVKTASTGGYEGYMLQITVTLDSELCSDISAPGATQAFSGRDIALTWAVLPGSQGDITLEADVRDFSMTGIQIAALPSSYDIDMSMLSSGSQLVQSGTELASGAQTIGGAVSSAASGAAGIDTLAAALDAAIASGDLQTAAALSAQLKQAASALSSGMSALSGSFPQFSEGLSQYVSGVSGAAEYLSSMFAPSEQQPEPSFAAEGEADVVQFVMKTSGIAAAGTEKPELPAESSTTLWQRILKIFGLYK